MHRISVKQRGLNRPHCHRHSCLAPLGRPTVHRLAPEPPDFRKQLPDAHPRRVERPLRALVQCSLLLHRLTQVLCFRPPLLLQLIHPSPQLAHHPQLHYLLITPHLRQRARERGVTQLRPTCSGLELGTGLELGEGES